MDTFLNTKGIFLINWPKKLGFQVLTPSLSPKISQIKGMKKLGFWNDPLPPFRTKVQNLALFFEGIPQSNLVKLWYLIAPSLFSVFISDCKELDCIEISYLDLIHIQILVIYCEKIIHLDILPSTLLFLSPCSKKVAGKRMVIFPQQEQDVIIQKSKKYLLSGSPCPMQRVFLSMSLVTD